MAYLGHNPEGIEHPHATPTIYWRPRTKPIAQPPSPKAEDANSKEQSISNGSILDEATAVLKKRNF